jgi:hypothetical protein
MTRPYLYLVPRRRTYFDGETLRDAETRLPVKPVDLYEGLARASRMAGNATPVRRPAFERVVYAFCVAVAVGCVVYFAGQMLRGVL